MSLEAKVALNWLDTIPQDLVTLKNFVMFLESQYEFENLVVCRALIREPIARFRNVCDVLERLQAKTLQDADSAPELRALMPDIVLAAFRLHEFLKRFSDEDILCRLIRNQKLVECLQQAHDDIDIFIDGVQRSRFGEIFSELATSAKIDVAVLNHSEADWSKKVDITSQRLQDMIAGQGQSRPACSGDEEEKDESAEVKKLNQVVEELLQITSKDQGKDSGLQIAMLKALWTLMFETQRNSRRGITDSLAATMETEMRSHTADAILMPWFIPADEITVGKQIGSGGFGAAFLGMLGFKTRVVVKRTHIKIFDADALRREISIWYQLNHPNIIQFYGATYVDSTCSIVSEFAGNGSLDSFLAISGNKKHLWHLLYEAAFGLHFMHDMGYAHGDLKCNNILVGEDLKAKLADFGLSFKNSELKKPPCTGAFQWLAPECFAKEGERCFSTDVYMLGMCIVEAVIGGPPWGANVKAGGQVRYQLLTKRQLPQVLTKLAPEVRALVMKMCAFKPADRMKLEDVIATLKQFADANDPDLLLVSA